MSGYVSIVRKARKNYTCDKCKETILKNEEYEYFQTTSPFYMKPERYHLKCLK